MFSIECKPLPVRIFAYCEETKKAFLSGFLPEDIKKVSKEESFQAVGNEKGWNGHLVVLVTIGEKKFLLDPSFDQISIIGIDIPHSVLIIPIQDKSIPDDHLDLTVGLLDNKDVIFSVDYFPLEDSSYETTPAWEFDSDLAVITGLVGVSVLDHVWDWDYAGNNKKEN